MNTSSADDRTECKPCSACARKMGLVIGGSFLAGCGKHHLSAAGPGSKTGREGQRLSTGLRCLVQYTSHSEKENLSSKDLPLTLLRTDKESEEQHHCLDAEV